LPKPTPGVVFGMARQAAHKPILGAAAAWTLACVTLQAGSAKALVASIVVDNDWALFLEPKQQFKLFFVSQLAILLVAFLDIPYIQQAIPTFAGTILQVR
jgi:hypothetical protein